jgi:hypothetical protein
MDTGTLPASALSIAVYAIYNPATNTWSTLGCDDSVSSGPIYGGSNMPASYTASALILGGVTDNNGHLQIFYQFDRTVFVAISLFSAAEARLPTHW